MNPPRIMDNSVGSTLQRMFLVVSVAVLLGAQAIKLFGW